MFERGRAVELFLPLVNIDTAFSSFNLQSLCFLRHVYPAKALADKKDGACIPGLECPKEFQRSGDLPAFHIRHDQRAIRMRVCRYVSRLHLL